MVTSIPWVLNLPPPPWSLLPRVCQEPRARRTLSWDLLPCSWQGLPNLPLRVWPLNDRSFHANIPLVRCYVVHTILLMGSMRTERTNRSNSKEITEHKYDYIYKIEFIFLISPTAPDRRSRLQRCSKLAN